MKVAPHPFLLILLGIMTTMMITATSPQVPAQEEETKDTAYTATSDETETVSYGLDVSFPIHGPVSTNYLDLDHNRDPEHYPTPDKYQGMPLQPLGNRQEMYLQHLDGCRQAFESDPEYTNQCDYFEYDRMLMNRRQPQSMVNLTTTGFQKIRAPLHLKDLIDDFWNKNHHLQKIENWGLGNAYLNHWDQPTTLVSVDDKGLRGSGARLKEHIWAAASAVIEEWTQQELQPCSLYGIRVYHEGAIMMPHVDRLPLVASAVINVAQDVDEDWPTEVYDHHGKAHNVTLHPGDMLLFESHSVVHGHPFPLKGRFYASIFIHFEPTGHALGKNESGYFYKKEDESSSSSDDTKRSRSRKSKKDLEEQYRQDTQKGFGGQSSSFNGKLPPYIKRESPEEANWLEQHPTGWQPPYEMLPPDAHVAAKKGSIDELEKELNERGADVLTERDEHGWQVLHQGVAGGNEEVVQFLINRGAEINARTHGGYGETPLRIAEKRLGLDSPIVKYLKKMGALSIGPEL